MLRLEILRQAEDTALSTEPAHLVATPRLVRCHTIASPIYGHRAYVKSPRNVQRLCIRPPDAPGQPVSGVVSHGDGLVDVFVGQHDANWAEQFFLSNLRVIVYVKNDCWLIVKPLLPVRWTATASSDSAPFLQGPLNISSN